ncbi:2-oxoacid:acceptor oxidoreductase subunit alpha [Acidiluteibacter ferrifornacis]|uniref:2-oxoacid:acceptor oxidoreductase subunit alpha n=1 Tax=Acidiluteibacter ferrifornacis TaxID=2692424 RepID=A0A6N9NDG7_9FLAO|nr:2-oxoacid:acceptor oxidoreductase subunit alpha [Acidiluteibacter ferrifornacis]NBG64626.1 2-oxoacid:acceptor oxidoreductase subunit alpha [Acidiluteibacter ferrifornacis]
MAKVVEEKRVVTIVFAGDSGDGIQLTGTQFTNTSALFGNDVSTFPNYPAEIRAPQGTVAGVSGFQLQFGSVEVYTAGDICDVLVAMNAAAFKVNLPRLKKSGTIIINTDGFNAKDLRLAGYESSPLEDKSLEDYRTISIDVTKLTAAALVDSGLGKKEVERSRNMFVLGFLYYMYNREIAPTEKFIKEKFAKAPHLIDANIKVLKAGYNFGDTSETFTSRYNVKAAKLPVGTYRNIMGNQATALGLVAASQKAGLDLFYGSYPITPASDILHELSKHKNFGVKTFQAEDEIAAVCSTIGASFGGELGVTASSGPGIALKGEAIGLAVMLELPMVVINVQRGGPSTGLPTKTEQADLMQAMYGRNGEAPMPVISASSPSDCFDAAFEACRIAIEHMTPVFFLSDGYMANGSEPWKFPTTDELKEIKVVHAKERKQDDPEFLPYKRDERLVREWALPGTKGLEHRIGGIEKEWDTGNISYNPENHERMVKVRAAKVARIADSIPLQTIDSGADSGKVLVLGWGSTYGVIKTALKECLEEGLEVSHAHLRYIEPFPKNLGEIIKKFDKVLIPEMNNGQLVKIIRDKFLVDAKGLNKIKGIPFSTPEIVLAIKELAHA